MIICKANPEDAGAIAAIWNPYIRETPNTFTTIEKTPPDIAYDIKACLGDNRAFLVATRDQTVLGFATYSQFRNGPGYARTMEHSVILSPQACGRGTGRAILQQLEDHARRAGIHSFVAGVSGENTNAIAFHERLGYMRAGVMPEMGRKFGRWMDLILLVKRL